MPCIPIEPALKRYDWGHRSFISLQLHRQSERLAEAWFGAHPQGASQLPDGSSLAEAIERDSLHFLGSAVKDRFHRLPFLVKLLAAERPLSVQVHPNSQQAELGFEREEALGIPKEAPERSYRDRFHKPELLLALTPFSAMAGFVDLSTARQRLGALPGLSFLVGEGSMESLVRAWYAEPPERARTLIHRSLDELERTAPETERDRKDPARWALFARRTLDSKAADRGLLFPFLLNILQLKPRQAILLSAGIPHAYLEGSGLEVMASSDNVLRAGLTTKPIRPKALFDVVRFDRFEPPLLSAQDGIYPSEVPEFRLRQLQGEQVLEAKGPQILLALGPQAHAMDVVGEEGRRTLEGGRASFVTPGRYQVRIPPPLQVYQVSVPNPP